VGPSSQETQQVDVLIGGAGFAGLALAIALRQGLGPSFSVAVADPALARDPEKWEPVFGKDHAQNKSLERDDDSKKNHPALGRAAGDARASAIVAAARRLFETIGVWQAIEAQPILDMVVTDSRLQDVARPTFLTFDGDVEPDEPFAHMIENGPLLAALVAKAEEAGVMLRPAAVADFFPSSSPPPERGPREARRVGVDDSAEEDPHPDPPPSRGREDSRTGPSHRLDVRLSSGATFAARLLVGADGAHSAIREHAGIASHGWSYGQSAIVATVAHERDHHGRAEEHFLPAGPFAILPLKDDAKVGHRSSIVWTEETQAATRIAALPDDDFHTELERRFGLHLGEIAAVGPRRVHPLGLSIARAFIADRLALVGDAAHVIHPIAGQGLNMGLKDVAALAEVIVDAVRLGLDPGSLAVLERYQRWRRFDTVAMGMTTDGLNRLFSNRSDVLRLVRDIGLGLVDRVPALKHFFIREAAGLVGEVPKLLRGEAL
jgi:2-octaprenyl-6-methoxyphenol hydroxylase